jgi:hypothetical protein
LISAEYCTNLAENLYRQMSHGTNLPLLVRERPSLIRWVNFQCKCRVSSRC